MLAQLPSKKTASIFAAMAAILLYLWLLTFGTPADAAPFVVPELGNQGAAEPVGGIFRRGRPPVYPYVYTPGRRNGWSFYFGFVPYEKGNYEIQALQRRYPESNWPPGMRYWTPKSQSWR